MSHKLFIAGGVVLTAVAISIAVLPPLTNPESIKEQREALGVQVNPSAGMNRGSMWKEMDSHIKDTQKDTERR